MRFTSLSLTNIRSYKEETIHFPKGKILLAGDVGAGKTTILLAIEFALFGILRGELAASSLLRKGTDQGKVSLTFIINDQEYKVVRTLKKDAKSIKQGNGSLNNESLTPVELKARILSLLGYDESLVSKAKSLVFRYTVYTPQESMKHILFESADDRLETLRKVFGIDQYKVMQKNTAMVLRELRSEQKAHMLQMEELPHKKKEIENKQEVLSLENKTLQDCLQKKISQEEQVRVQEEKMLVLKKEATLFHETTRELSSITRVYEELQRRKITIKTSLEQLRKEQNTKETSKDLTIIKEKIAKGEAQISIIRERSNKAREQLATTKSLEAQAVAAKNKLLGLGSACPLCEQEVPHTHKDALVKEQEEKISSSKKKSNELQAFIDAAIKKETQTTNAVRALQQELIAATKEEEAIRFRKEKIRSLEEEEQKNSTQLQKDEEQIAQLQKKLKTISFNPELFEQEEIMLRERQKEVQQTKIIETRTQTTINSLKDQILSIEQSLKRLEQHKVRADTLAKHAYWLKEMFVPLTDTIEKRVFSSVHQEFNALFTTWFNQIIDDESLAVRLDEEFSPIILLNGYETEIQALSGGEKTALALAYRLSLHQVINEFIGTIATRDILILDEPTDGFSSFQLDKMRDVLEQVKVEQLIIVSHEEKIEGFVDTIIKVRKEEQVSNIEQ